MLLHAASPAYDLHAPSAGSLTAFLVIVAAVAVAIIAAAYASADTREWARRRAIWAALAVVAYAGLTAAIALSGVLQSDQPIPRAMPFLASIMTLATVLAMSGIGRQVAQRVSIPALVLFQSFRLPLELVLHRWYEEGSIPIEMTYEGYNFDIVSGIAALAAFVWLRRSGPSARVAWTFNIVATGLLAAVIHAAVRSMDLFEFGFHPTPALTLVYHAPYIWIVTFCVAGALAGHLVLFRKLWAQRLRDQVSAGR